LRAIHTGKGERAASCGAMQYITHAVQKATHQVTEWTNDLSHAFEGRKQNVREFVEIWMKIKLKDQAEIFVDRIPPYVKKQLYDPYMPRCVKAILHKSINRIWPDVREEIMWEVQVMIDGNETKYEQEKNNKPGPNCLLAFLRYRLFPYDRGIWQCCRDPVFVVVNILCYVPPYGIWAWMFLMIFLIIDKKDEYQLVYFILYFKGCQFFSWGIIKGLVGFLQYFSCVTFPNLSEVASGKQEPDPSRCMTNGPGMKEEYFILVGSWLLPLVLVWICMLLLSGAEEKGRSKLKILDDEAATERAASRTSSVYPSPSTDSKGEAKKQREANKKSGGYLQSMLIFDLVIFVLCVGMLCIIVANQPHVNTTGDQIQAILNAQDDDWQVKQTFYCCQFIYGLFSVVFVPFNLPFLSAVLTHSPNGL